MVKKSYTKTIFLKTTEKSRSSKQPPFYFYSTVIRPVPEYCVPAWHYALTNTQTEQLEAVQKRAIDIILNFSRAMPYMFMLSTANLTTLASRREDISRKFFTQITEPTSCLINFSLIQEITLSFLDLGRNFPECLLGQNDIVPLYSMH